MMVVSRIREEAEKGTRWKIKEDDHERSIRSSKHLTTNNSIRILVNAYNTPRIKRDGLLAETIFFILAIFLCIQLIKITKKTIIY